MDIDNICIALQKSINKFEDQIEFFKTNYNKMFMTMGDKENKLCYTYVYTYVYTRTRTHTHTHTQIHIHTHTGAEGSWR
jgi:hypothetical protein